MAAKKAKVTYMKQPNIKTNTIYSVIKSVASVLFPLITFPYASRVLLPEGIGKVNFAHSIVNYFSLLASLGLATYAIRECSRVREDRNKLGQVASELMSLNIVTTLISFALLALTLLFARPLDDYRALIVLQSSTIAFTALGTDWLNSAMEDFKLITLRTVGFQFLSLLLMLLFVHSPDDYMIYALTMVISASGAALVNIFYRRRFCQVRFTWRIPFKRHLPPVLLLFAMQLSQVIFTNADVTMLGLIHGDLEVGLYNAAIKIYNIVSQVVSSILWVVMPRLSLYYAQQDYSKINPLLRKVLGFSLALGLPCITGLNMLAPEIVQVIGGPEYIPAAPALQLLTISLFFSFIGGSFIGNVIMLPSKREKHFLVACCIAAVTNVVLNAALIPSMNIYGAAIATAVSAFVIFIILLPKMEKEIQLGNLWTLSIPPVLGCAGIAIICILAKLFLSDLWIRSIVAIGLSTLVYALVLILCRYEMVAPTIRAIKKKFLRKG